MDFLIFLFCLGLVVVLFVCLFVLIGKLSEIIRLLRNIDLQILDARGTGANNYTNQP